MALAEVLRACLEERGDPNDRLKDEEKSIDENEMNYFMSCNEYMMK